MDNIKHLKINGKEVPLVEPAEVITTIKNKKTGEVYKPLHPYILHLFSCFL